jgi:phosphoribosylamine--glycine ligase
VVGGGGREHALAWRLALDGAEVTVAPGNGGTPRAAPVQATDIEALADLAAWGGFDFTVVGPEVPLSLGIVDAFQARRLRIFGPTQRAARLEYSKAWQKEFLLRHGIPTGRAELVDGPAAGRRALAKWGLPVVVKADGLAAGKGVWVVTSDDELEGALAGVEALDAAGQTMLVEECLSGPELSLLVLTDGERYSVMPPARDYKRIGDGDRGPNTGGMGGYTWPADVSQKLIDEVAREVLEPTLAGMAAEGAPYRGVLYAGLMLTSDGPRVLEFNCRFGDPECQLILPLLETPLVDAVEAVIDGRLVPSAIRWRRERTYGVVLAAAGYPEAPRSGDAITIGDVPGDVYAFHAGTAKQHGQLVTAGGRVMTLVSNSRTSIYAAAEAIDFAGKQFRRDIGVEPHRSGHRAQDSNSSPPIPNSQPPIPAHRASK